MADVLEELTGDVALTRDHVQRRVDEWAQRIEDLYARIESWLPPGWTAARADRTVRLHEEPMREVGLPPRDLPVLELFDHGTRAATVAPRSLWIVGANGRLDLTCGSAHYLIIDVAEIFEPAEWRIGSLGNRTNPPPLNQAALRSVLQA